MDQLPCTSFFGRNMSQRWTGARILSLNIWLLDFFETLRWLCSSGPKPQSVSQALQELHADTSAERSTCWAVLVIQGESTVFNAVQPKTLQWCLHMFPHVSTVWTSKRAGLSDHASQNGLTMRALPSPKVRTCASSMLQGLSLQPQHSKTRSDKWWNDMNCI